MLILSQYHIFDPQKINIYSVVSTPPPPLYYYFFHGPLGTWRSILRVVMQNRGQVCTVYTQRFFPIYCSVIPRDGYMISCFTANEGPVRIQYKCLVPIYVFPEQILRPALLFPKKVYNVLSPNFHIHVSVSTIQLQYKALVADPKL